MARAVCTVNIRPAANRAAPIGRPVNAFRQKSRIGQRKIWKYTLEQDETTVPIAWYRRRCRGRRGRRMRDASQPFDQAYIRNLFALGHEMALTESPWFKYPPGFDPTPIKRSRSAAGE